LIMRRILVVGFVALILALPGVAPAGTNPGVKLMVHGNVDGVDTAGDPFTAIPAPANVSDFREYATQDPNGVEWFILCVVSPEENSPNFNTVEFGTSTDFDTGVGYIGFWGPIDPGAPFFPLEVSTATWPNDRAEGTAISWAPGCFTAHIQPIYYMGVYPYAGGPIPLGPHPVQGQSVVDCEDDPGSDELAELPTLNISQTPVCCLPETCEILTQEDCVNAGGTFTMGEFSCYADPCPSPTQNSTWGSIKQTYR